MPPSSRINWTAIGILFALAMQLFVSVWWTSKLDSRVCNLEDFAKLARPQIEQIATLRQSDEQILRTLNKIESGQDKLLEKIWALHTPDHTPVGSK